MIEPIETNPKSGTFDTWGTVELMAMKKYLLQFGYGRWSKIRSISKHSALCKILWKKTDDEMRPYANMFLIHLINCIDENNI